MGVSLKNKKMTILNEDNEDKARGRKEMNMKDRTIKVKARQNNDSISKLRGEWKGRGGRKEEEGKREERGGERRSGKKKGKRAGRERG